jgi:ComF family protein
LLCNGCESDMPRIIKCCRQCGLPGQWGTTKLCADCVRKPPAWDSAVAALVYEYPIDQLVQNFKFHRDTASGQLLAEELARAVMAKIRADAGDSADLIIPVPLHFLRQFRRGFNQAEMLASVIGKHCGIPIGSKLLQRRTYTTAQSGLSRKARRKNLRHAFNCPPIKAGHVALVDDVLTTGTTLQECSRVLKAAGAHKVSVWVAARVPAPGQRRAKDRTLAQG